MRLVAVLVVVAVLAGTASRAARALGDPASDVLLTDNVFLSFNRLTRAPRAEGSRCSRAAAKRQRFPVKVAVITQIADLGTVARLYGRAQRYADLLAPEITGYRGTLVVAMNGDPGGFGVHGPGATPGARRALAAMKLPRTPPTSAELARLAAVAVQRVAAASGHHLAVPAEKKKTSTRLLDVFLVAAVGLVLLAGGAALLARWLRGGQKS